MSIEVSAQYTILKITASSYLASEVGEGEPGDEERLRESICKDLCICVCVWGGVLLASPLSCSCLISCKCPPCPLLVHSAPGLAFKPSDSSA